MGKADKCNEPMTLSRFTNVGSIASLVDAGRRVLSRVSDDTFQNLALFVDGMDSDKYHANDQLVFLRGIVAIDNPRLFKTGAVARQFANRLTAYDLYKDAGEAFALPDVMRLSSHSGAVLESQIDLMDRITTVAGEHAGIMMMLGLMKERLGGHYYHGLRAGIAFCARPLILTTSCRSERSCWLVSFMTWESWRCQETFCSSPKSSRPKRLQL